MGVIRPTGYRVNELVCVKWNNEKYSVLVEEELGEWVPECIEDGSGYADSVSNSIHDEVMPDPVMLDEPITEEEVDVNTGSQENVNVEGDGKEDSRQVAQEGVQGDLSQVDNAEAVENDTNDTMDARGKKSRGYRKKARAQKSPSPTGQERPKKRAREGEDLFDIDRFIYTINGNEMPSIASEHNVEAVQVVEEYGNDQVVIEPSGLSNEVNETVRLAGVLGVENLDNFEALVNKEVLVEGFQQVDQ